MKKNLTKFLAMTLCILMSIVCVSCSGGGGTRVIEPGTDPTDKRPSMYISVFNGGYGRAWLDTIVNDFNKEYPDNKYKVVVRANKDEFASIKSGIMSGTFTPDMFFSNLYIHQLISGGYLENISDVWTSDPDGDGSTIESLMYNSDTYKQAYGDGKGGLYALPLQESLRSFVYDHDLFLEYWVCWRVENKETNCISRRVREDMVKDSFVNMVYKLKYNKQILTDAIETIEAIEDTAGIGQEEIRKIDKEIADLSAKNLVITRLHTSGIMSATDFSALNSTISNRITKLRRDRKKKFAEAENDEINILKELDETITDYAPNGKFDEDLFENIVEKVIPQSNEVLKFRLIGGVELVETIKEKGRCGSNEMS